MDDCIAEKINTSIIQTIRAQGHNFTVSVNLTGITISENYTNTTINLKKGIKNKMTYPWSVFIKQLDEHREELDKTVEDIANKKKGA